MKKEHVIVIVALLVGVMASDKIRQLPGLNKLPTF